jgi:hypothetical protein
MWIISKTGFVSLVEHDQDQTMLRARARRREHLVNTFTLADDQVIDLGVRAPDYRWHADVPRQQVADVMAKSVMDLDYHSHVKEAITGGSGPKGDPVFYRAMMSCWNALFALQRPPAAPREPDFWDNRKGDQMSFSDAEWDSYDDIPPYRPGGGADWRDRLPPIDDHGRRRKSYVGGGSPFTPPPPTEHQIGGLAGSIAERMTAAGTATPTDGGLVWHRTDDGRWQANTADGTYEVDFVTDDEYGEDYYFAEFDGEEAPQQFDTEDEAKRYCEAHEVGTIEWCEDLPEADG